MNLSDWGNNITLTFPIWFTYDGKKEIIFLIFTQNVGPEVFFNGEEIKTNQNKLALPHLLDNLI